MLFASDSGTTNARWEHLLPSTKAALNPNAQGLHLSVAQFITGSKTAALYQGPGPAVMRETNAQLKGFFCKKLQN